MVACESCMSEAQKYQGALYRGEGKGKKGKQQNNQKNNWQNNSQNNSQPTPVHKAYVEDAQDEYDNSQLAAAPSIPEAPSPPAAVNVFDFLVDPTPNASKLDLPVPDEVMNDSTPEHQVRDEPMSDNADISEAVEKPSTDLVRVNLEDNNQALTDLVEWGSGPVPTTGPFETPAPKVIEWKPTKEHEAKSKKDKKDEKKKDKKRKRLHVDTHDLSSREGDVLMDDAPPVLHSGLTGGLNKLLRPSVFPPSPDYSGVDAEKESPSAKPKKTKESKRASRARTRTDTFGSNLMSLITTRQTSREHSEDRPKKRKHKHGNKSSERPKMLEYNPMNGVDDSSPGENQMVVYKPRAELLMSMVNKGPNSEKGVSMNKALKRYHRERTAAGLALGKGDEEKELWRSLRMKKNDRGEIVLFM
ncbi:hypothetical protein NHQ30_000212 [Ciborinia camelliae]|nr:hypothetical protein NHQ30_000212 [Ciborinia camelliae]